jgi:hypothetical protein
MDIIKLERKNAQDLLVKLMSKYKDNLNYYKIPADEQSILGENYNRAIQRFTPVMKDNNDLAFYEKNRGFQHISKCLIDLVVIKNKSPFII